MERKFVKQLLTGVVTLLVSITFASCSKDNEDLNTEISQVKTELAAATTLLGTLNTEVFNIKQEATDQAIRETKQAIENLIKGDSAKPITLEDLAPVLGQLLVLSEQLKGLEALESVTRAKDILLTKADAQTKSWVEVLIGYHKRIADLELQAKVLGLAKDKEDGNYVVASGILNTMQKEINSIKVGFGHDPNYEDIARELTHVDEFIKFIATQIRELLPNLITLETTVRALITAITYVDINADDTAPAKQNLSFPLVTSLTNFTFGGSRTGAIEFSTQRTSEGIFTDYVYVRVTPTNAILSKENLVLINSDGTRGVEEYIKPYSVEPYTKKLTTKADASPGGIYKVTFTLGENFDEKKLEALTKASATDFVLFAVAVESISETGNRYVATNFGTTIKTDKGKSYTYNTLAYTANNTSVTKLYNRFDGRNEVGKVSVDEYKWSSTTPATNLDPFASTEISVDRNDMRKSATYPKLSVSIGGAITIALDEAFAKNVLAYYVDLDTKFASTEAELSLWQSAEISGLDKVYSVDEKAIIRTLDDTLENLEVGYRVYAVNYNGTLVDPDGKAFYVSYIPNTLTGSRFDFTATVTKSLTTASEIQNFISDEIPIVFPDELDVSKIATFKLNISGITTIKSENLTRHAEAGEARTWQETKRLSLKRINLTELKDNGSLYTGTLELLNAEGYTLIVYPITLQKVLPTKFPVIGIRLKPDLFDYGQLVVNDIQAGISQYNFLTNMDFSKPDSLTFSKVKADLAVQLSYTTADGKTVSDFKVSTGSADNRVINWTVPSAAVRRDVKATVAYNFGNVSYAPSGAAAPYLVPSDMNYTLYISSTLDDVHYSWDQTGWNQRIYYDRSEKKIKAFDSVFLPVLADIKAQKGSASNVLTIDTSDFYTSITQGKSATLRLLDTQGNYINLPVTIPSDAATPIEFPTTAATTVSGPSGGATVNGVTVNTFNPVKAVLYLSIQDKNGVTWGAERIIEFNIDATQVKPNLTGGDIEIGFFTAENAPELDAYLSGVSKAIIASTPSDGITTDLPGITYGSGKLIIQNITLTDAVRNLLQTVTFPTSIQRTRESLDKIITGESNLYTLAGTIYTGATLTEIKDSYVQINADGKIELYFGSTTAVLNAATAYYIGNITLRTKSNNTVCYTVPTVTETPASNKILLPAITAGVAPATPTTPATPAAGF
jgi:hypothetical protein